MWISRSFASFPRALLLLGLLAPAGLGPQALRPAPAAAQEPDPAEPGAPDPDVEEPRSAARWNSPFALELADRAVRARSHTFADTALRSFQAEAEGHVYYLAEFGDRSQLMRADQVALRILWQAPDRALQTIVGRRHERRLPTTVRYHIDHLSVVLDNYGDLIRIGEGDEVRDVLHPAAPGALRRYDFRLVDSLDIEVRDRRTRVYRLQVRPSDSSRPGLVGSIYVDRETGAIARLHGTFTAASYVDPQLERVAVDLRSALWEGRWWLPAEQEVEVRRSVQWLDLSVAGIIRTEMRIGGYRLNEAPPYSLAPGERVASYPAARLAAYDAWGAGLYDAGIRPGERDRAALDEMVAEARELVGPRALVASPPFRGHLPDATAAVRARRAEGLLLGAGARIDLDAQSWAGLWAGWPFARERPQARLTLARRFGEAELELRLVADRLADVGPFPGASGLVSTVGTAVDGEDWTDPYFEDGGELLFRVPVGAATTTLGVHALRQRSAWLAAGPLGSGSARPVRPVDPGTLTAVSLEVASPVTRALAADWRLSGRSEAGLAGPGDFGFTRLLVRLRADGQEPASAWGWSAGLSAGAGTGGLPAQRLFLLGGRATLPGHPFREWGGDRVLLLEGEVSRDVVRPWVRARLLGAAGRTWLGGPGAAGAGRLGLDDPPGVRGSVGAGLGLFYDLLRLDLHHGIGPAGDWEFVVSMGEMLDELF